jgi:hypothetical protein
LEPVFRRRAARREQPRRELRGRAGAGNFLKILFLVFKLKGRAVPLAFWGPSFVDSFLLFLSVGVCSAP